MKYFHVAPTTFFFFSVWLNFISLHIKAEMEKEEDFLKKVRVVDTYKNASSNAKIRLIYDILLVIYFTTLWFLMFIDCGPNYFTFFYYLTNWGLTSTLLFFISATLVDYERLTRVTVSSTLIYICTFLRELSVSLQSVIVPFFWIIVYSKERWRRVSWECQVHGMGLLFTCIDYTIRMSNFSSLSSKNLFMVVLSYLTLNYFVVSKLETMIYPGITYNTLESWLVVSSAIILVLLAHQLASIIAMCLLIKDKLWQRHKNDHFIRKVIKVVQKAQEIRKKGSVRKRLGSIFVG